ncbi:hypothetical protein LOTGIDRAFT_155624 [Lottia gigantea]|uniref:C-type lectin domain-containing protein n=1 Tax=Lottia gigantea TaxID=225164 RepID=V3ZJQ9_LOTGI|nr:hypothetical protein LOTGIDRAFT_155624 [Lottia gigantea]ESO82610.1 hypothetical protein LOTGIDRAFT_155624 [Lottia gigantea]
MKTYTMYTDQQSWNAANMICSLRGGYLVKIESSSENSFLLDRLDNTWVNGGDSFYIGLHNAALKENTAEYFWTDCTPIGNYDDLDSNSEEYILYCVILYKGSKFSNPAWRVKDCTDVNSFVCETDGGLCDYIIFNNTIGIQGISFNAAVMGQNDCLRLCDEAILNGMECWGVTYYIYTETCILHLSNDSTIFDNGGKTSNTGSIFLKKQCLKVDVDNTVYPSISPTNIPYTNCFSTPSTGSIYTIIERAVTWQEAKDVCSHIGASLLEYRSTEEFTDVLKIATPSLGGISSFWIGLKRYTNLTFLWQDGTDIATWDKWESLPSNTHGTCVRASTTLLWLEDNCTNSHSFICEQPGVCGYEVVYKTKGNDGSLHFLKSHLQCIGICDSDKSCIAYNYINIVAPCITYHQSDIYYYFDNSNYQTDNSYDLYRYSCSHDKTVLLDVIQRVLI